MTDDKTIRFTFITVVFFFFLLVFILLVATSPLRSRAASNTLSLKIKLQGVRKELDKVKVHIDFYDGPNKVSEEPEVIFTYENGIFSGDIVFASDFDFNKRYALFIKPEKHIGRVFCNSQLTGTQCTTPQFFFLATGSSYDLTSQIFLSGDVPPSNGKVDAQDMSLIMKDLGKVSSESAATDINSDGITDVVDYSLAFYSLSNNAIDDIVNLTAPTDTPTPTQIATPTATLTPTMPATPSPTLQPSPTVTVVPSVTPTPTVRPTLTPTLRPTISVGVCHLKPGPMAVSICGESERDMPASTTWSACQGSTGTNPLCKDIKVKARCTCAPGKICVCQLKDEPTQTVQCTNGGKFEALLCE
ncbi:MAG: hypothetical protein WC489_04450 [Patescibacteria group bacterium]